MKLNWGYKILIGYSLFVIGILFLGYKSTQLNFDLVEKDYYGKELKYQNVIDASGRATALGGILVTNIQEGKLIIQFPDSLKGLTVKGLAYLYYPADAQKDLKKEFTTDKGLVEMELLTKTKGNYTLKLDIEKEGQKYYFEQKIFF
jgi:hypothetical protein